MKGSGGGYMTPSLFADCIAVMLMSVCCGGEMMRLVSCKDEVEGDCCIASAMGKVRMAVRKFGNNIFTIYPVY